MTNRTIPRPTIPRDSINPLGVETIVLPVKAPALARGLIGPPGSRFAGPRSLRDSSNPRCRESLLASVVTPPQTNHARNGSPFSGVLKLRILAPILVIVAAGLSIVRVVTAPHTPTRSTAPNQHGIVTTQQVASQSSTGAPKQAPATARIPVPVVDGKSAERQAVDAVARGAYSEAADLYTSMAGEGDDVFRVAARIAARKSRRER